MGAGRVIYIIGTVFLLAVAQVFMKIAARGFNFGEAGLVRGLILNVPLLVALAIYAVATIAWLVALRGAPLRLVYPFAGLGFIIVPVLAHYFLGESLSWSTVVGGVLILLGIWVSGL